MSAGVDIFIYLILLCCGRCISFTTVSLPDACENTIYDEAGELTIDHTSPSYMPDNKCSVTIQPRSDVLTGPTHVMFYFTKFELTGPCGTMNVSVFENSSSYGHPVKGLSAYICEHNSSLEEDDQIFTTTSDTFTVTFRGINSLQRYPGNVTIKFIVFQTGGECEGFDVVQCQSGRCVNSKYLCSKDINICVNNSTNCELLEDLKQLLNSILEIAKDFLWLVPLIIGLCVLKVCYRRNKNAICRMKDSVCTGLGDSSREGRNAHTDMTNLSTVNDSIYRRCEDGQVLNIGTARRREPGQSPSSYNQAESEPLYPEQQERLPERESNESSYCRNDIGDTIITPSAPPLFSPTNVHLPSYGDLRLPPSYDEVMKNSTKYKSDKHEHL